MRFERAASIRWLCVIVTVTAASWVHAQELSSGSDDRSNLVEPTATTVKLSRFLRLSPVSAQEDPPPRLFGVSFQGAEALELPAAPQDFRWSSPLESSPTEASLPTVRDQADNQAIAPATNVAPKLCELPPLCDNCRSNGYYLLLGYDSWRGISTTDWQNNGVHAGGNFGTRLGEFSDRTGIGAQVGGTVGVFDWSGTDYRPQHQSSPSIQGFLTYGFFRKANADSSWSASIVQDWMLNNNFGTFGQSPTLSQWRAQVGYALNSQYEVGLWGAWRTMSSTHNIGGFGPTTWRPIDQINLYVHKKWGVGQADTWLWVGLPERDRVSGNGSLGDWTVGALANCPLNDSVALYALTTYMHPSAGAGPIASVEEAWNFTIGISIYPQRNSRSTTVAGQCWMPQLPIANNGTFLVDTNRTN